MPKEHVRSKVDGPVGVQRIGGDIIIDVVHDGEEERIVCSEFNARRILGALSVLLQVPLSASAAKSIKM